MYVKHHLRHLLHWTKCEWNCCIYDICDKNISVSECVRYDFLLINVVECLLTLHDKILLLNIQYYIQQRRCYCRLINSFNLYWETCNDVRYFYFLQNYLSTYFIYPALNILNSSWPSPHRHNANNTAIYAEQQISASKDDIIKTKI